MEKRILVTGGTGMVGNYLKEILPDAMYIGSKDCDLTDNNQVDSSEWSGTINADSEESKIVRKLAKAYVEGNFEITAKYMADDAINLVNGVEYSKDDWIAGYKRDQEIFDNIQHNNDNIM